MNTSQIIIAAAAAATGGAVGAVGTALLSWNHMVQSVSDLRKEIGSSDPKRMVDAAQRVLGQVDLLGQALAKLRSALRIR
jgi:hypothetical protein